MRQFFLLFLLSSVGALLGSCSNESFHDQECDYSSSPLQPITWQEQLDYAKNSNQKTKAISDGISLQGYTYKGTISVNADIPVIIEELFSENSVIVQHTGLGFSSFEIVSIGTIIQSMKELGGDDPFVDLISQLKTSIMVGMELVELEWLYKGNTFYSTAIVSNDYGGLIYDNIGTFILVKSADSELEGKDMKSNIPIVKTRSESGNSLKREFSLSDSGRNVYGMTVYSYSISCYSYFNKEGVLYDRTLNANYDSAIGWSCKADIKTISGNINSSRYHEFAWAYAYGAAVSVSLGWNGNGFTLSGGGTGRTGTAVHRL